MAKIKLLYAIQTCCVLFPKHTENIKTEILPAFSVEQLQQTLEAIKVNIAVKNTSMALHKKLEISISSLELLCCHFTPLKLQGLSNIVKEKEFLDLLNEFFADSPEMFYSKPIYRLIGYLGVSLLDLHVKNTAIESEFTEKFVKQTQAALTKQIDSKIQQIDDEFDRIV